MHRITLEPTYILHRRPYSNSSWIVELLTAQHGRVAVIARSARGPSSRYKGQLELFRPMLASFSGQRELKTLGSVEFDAPPHLLSGTSLLCGFYLNELLIRLLPREDPHQHLFIIYQQTLQCLATITSPAAVLRCFEKKLLMELGYGLPLNQDIADHSPIQPQQYYQYLPERGFLAAETTNHNPTYIFSGQSLLALHHEHFSNKHELRDAKRLMRIALDYHLGDKPLKSRDLLL